MILSNIIQRYLNFGRVIVTTLILLCLSEYLRANLDAVGEVENAGITRSKV